MHVAHAKTLREKSKKKTLSKNMNPTLDTANFHATTDTNEEKLGNPKKKLRTMREKASQKQNF